MKAAKARRLSGFERPQVFLMTFNIVRRYFSFIFRDRWLLGIMALALVLGLIYNGAILFGFGPDEARHMNYVKLLLNEHTLPYLEADGVTEHGGAHTLHPPLYYLLLVPFYALFRGLPSESEWHVVRVVSVLLCLAALPLIYQIAQRASGKFSENENKWLPRLVVAQIALLPIFGMTSGAINNDSATLLAVAFFLWLLAVKFPRERSLKSALILGIVFGLGGLTKATAILCNGAALAAYFWAQDGPRAFVSLRAWQRTAIISGLVLLISGPWYARNIAQFGQFTPIPQGYSNPRLPDPKNGVLVMALHDNFPLEFARTTWSIFYTTWSQKDWIPGPQPDLPSTANATDWRTPIYGALAVYCVLALLGWGWEYSRHRVQSKKGDDDIAAIRAARWPAYAAFFINWLACLWIALFVHAGWGEGGRYLLPSLAGFSLALAIGWRGLIGEKKLSFVVTLWIAAMLAFNAVTIWRLLTFLNPTYGR
jgi:4-amino-4-deoxy-L-arabinose transferase-like glycosyltransferase